MVMRGATIGAMFGDAGAGTFLGLPGWDGAPGPRAVVIGADTATPYASVGPYCAGGAAAIRAGSAGHAAVRGHWSFDLGGVAVPEGAAADAGDVAVGPDPAANRAAIGAAVERVLAAGAVPVLLGGDDSVAIPFIAAFHGHGAAHGVGVVQLDAHADWRDEIGGERMGLSSVMRRASEMRHVGAMVQVGQRGIGSARAAEAEAMAARGVTLVTAGELARAGVGRALEAVVPGVPVVVVLDWDVIDPAVMPAVIARTAGGLGYWHAVDLIAGVAARAPIAGVALTEFMPDRDLDGQGAAFAASLVTTVIGLIVRQGRAVGG
ncbi:MAG: arginase family protein [Gemmobacter sp.]